MSDFPSRISLYGIGRNYVLTRAQRIDPNQVDVQGSDINLVVGGQSEVSYAIVLQLIQAFNSLTLDGAVGDNLDRYALDRYGSQLSRKGASAAIGSVTFNRQNPNNPSGTISAGTILLSQTNAQYVTLQPTSFTTATGAASDTTVTVPIRAAQAGAIFQATQNQITKFQTPNNAIGFDTSITANNPISTSGGADAELDEVFRNRIRTFWVTARRGILPAIEQGATSVPGVASAYAFEYTTSQLSNPSVVALSSASAALSLAATALTAAGSTAAASAASSAAAAALAAAPNAFSQPARVVSLSIADATGVANQQLADAVQQALLEYRAAGIQVIISPGIPLLQAIALHLQFTAGTDTVTLSGIIQAAIVNFVNNLSVSGPLYLGQLQSLLQRFASQGLVPSQGSILSPTGDILPAPGQTIRTNLALVTLN
jgi:hypothetical protein